MPPSYRSAHATAAKVTTVAPADTPAEDICIDLAKLARSGQLSDIEDWLRGQSLSHADHSRFFDEVREALQMLDFERIESMALAGVKDKQAFAAGFGQ